MGRVLIVEDEHTDRIILLGIVEQAGHEAFFAFGGEEALDIYEKVGIDIVITDLSMPDGDGLGLIEALRAFLPEKAIIAVSGLGPDQLAAAKGKGALVALSKPVDPYELAEALAKATPHGSAAPARRNVG